MDNALLWQCKKSWSTHQPMLIKTIAVSTGPVLEIGAGLFSTPFLHWICKVYRRRLYTLEGDINFYKWAKQFTSSEHRIKHVKVLEDFDYKSRHWGVVFIDHNFGIRGQDAIKFKDIVDYLVVHDFDDFTNNSKEYKEYNYDVIPPFFKNCFIDIKCRPWTAVFSNFKNLSELDY